MDPRLSRLIQQKWREEQVPPMNGLLLADGHHFAASYFPVTIGGISGSGARFADTPSPLDPALEWWAIIETASVAMPERKLRYCCGEGAHGSYGFVAAADAETGALIWLAFFQDSNPFHALKLRDGRLIATNNHGHH